VKKGLVGFLTVLLLAGVVGAVTAASINGDYKSYPIVNVFVEGQKYTGEVPAINFEGTTMVPVRFVAETLGQQVNWDGSTWTVSIGESAAASGKTSQELKDAGGGFYYGNISFSESYGYVDGIGEMVNSSGKSYSFVTFTMSLYDANNKLIGTGPIIITNFSSGQTKSFDSTIKADIEAADSYKIQFENAM